MKIRIGENVYLQKYEVTYMTHSLNSLPANFFQEIFGDDENNFFYMNGAADTFQFKCVFKDPADVKWLMEQDWIVDYDEFAEVPLPELEALVERLKAERDTSINEFNIKDIEYREKHFEEENERIDKIRHKISSFKHLISARKGDITFVFPDGYHEEATPDTASTPEKKPGFFARLFGRGAQ